MGGWNEDDLGVDEEDEEEEITPDNPDYDLSEAHGYAWYPPEAKPAIPRWALVTVTVLVIMALIVPSLLLVLRYS